MMTNSTITMPKVSCLGPIVLNCCNFIIGDRERKEQMSSGRGNYSISGMKQSLLLLRMGQQSQTQKLYGAQTQYGRNLLVSLF
jgi:hypothetical protein